jgi:hypothetical protein
MADIVERLARVRRHLDGCRYPFGAGAVQAAISEIERLRAEVAAQVEAARREALDEAAEVCKKRARAWEDSCYSLALSWRDEAECCAAAIRARGDA